MMAAYAELDIHICQMMHSAIMALAVSVPTVHLPYDVKGASFFRLMNLEQYCIAASQATENDILALAEGLLAGRQAIAAQIDRRRQELAAMLESAFRRIGALVTGT